MTIKQRVKAGAKFLDKREPGWEKKVNLKKLQMYNCFSCVLGQTDSDYDSHKKGLRISEDQAVRLGFQIAGNKYSLSKFNFLTEAWKDLIRKRRKK